MAESKTKLIDYREFEKRTGFPAVASKAELSMRGARHAVLTQPFYYNGQPYQIEQMQYGDFMLGFVYIWKRATPIKSRRTEEILFRIHGVFWPEGDREYRHYTVEELVQTIQPEKQD